MPTSNYNTLLTNGEKMKKSKAWYTLFPSDPYALGPFRFETPIDEKELRKYVKNWDGIKRLPRGFKCWITND
jgi:hypothetical protein